MTHTVEELWRLLHQAHQMPYGSAQIALVEQLIRGADATGDRELTFAARMLGTTAYTYGGEPAKSFVTFSWCLAEFDREPADYHQRYVHELLWQFKWMVNALTDFPEVPLDRTYAVLDDMERRYRDGGHSLQAVYKHRYLVARHIGAEDEADEWYARWLTAPRDELSDCAGCDPSAQVRYLASRGRDEEAVALAEPVLAGRLSCAEQPQVILTTLLLPYLRTGRQEAARDAHRRAYRLVRGSLANLYEIGEHIAFCARTGNESRGLEIVERHLDWLDRAPSPAAAMEFAASAALVLRRLTDSGHADLTVHRRAYQERPARDVPVGELAADLTAYAVDLAARFDARNGSAAQGRHVRDLLEAEPVGEYLPLSATLRRRPPVPAQRTAGEQVVPGGQGSAVPGPEVVVPADATPARLLELAEEHDLADRWDAVLAVLAEFDARFDDSELEVPLRARRAEFRGEQRYLSGDLDGADQEWDRARELHLSTGDLARVWSVTGQLGVLRCLRGATDEGSRLVAECATYFAEHGDARRQAAARARVGLALLTQERLVEALAEHDHAAELLVAAYGEDLATSVEPGIPQLAARIELIRAQILRQLDRLEDSRAAAVAARAGYRRLGSAANMATAALVYAQTLDDPAEAVRAYDEAILAASRAVNGVDQVMVDARLGRARALVAADQPDAAVDDFVEAIGVYAERGVDHAAVLTTFELAHAYYRAGRLVEAAEAGEEALVGLTKLDAQAEADRCRHLLATCYARIGEDESALEMFDQLAVNLDGPDNLPIRGQVLEEAGDLLYRKDRDALAAQRFAAAAEAYGLAGLHLDQLRATRRHTAALYWAGETDATVEALHRADQLAAGLPADVADEPAAVWERAMLSYDAARIMVAADRLDDALARITDVPDRFRSIEAFGEAVQAELLLGEVLLRQGRPDAAEPVLRGALAALPRDSGPVHQAAWLLARALSDLGRSAEAAALRAEYDLADEE